MEVPTQYSSTGVPSSSTFPDPEVPVSRQSGDPLTEPSCLIGGVGSVGGRSLPSRTPAFGTRGVASNHVGRPGGVEAPRTLVEEGAR